MTPNSAFTFTPKEEYDHIWLGIGNVSLRIDVSNKYTSVQVFAKGCEEYDPIKVMDIEHQEIQDIIDNIEV